MTNSDRPTNVSLTKKDPTSVSIYNSDFINFNKSIEEQIFSLIKFEKIENLNDIKNVESIYELLIKIKNFKEFIKLNELDKEKCFQFLQKGIIKKYKLDEIIYDKGKYPKYYFLVLYGSVSYIDKRPRIFTAGSFFGREIMKDIKYKYTAIAKNKNTILLLVPKKICYSYLKDIILTTIDNIQNCLERNFHIFKTFNRPIFEKYYRRMIILYPFTGELIVSNEEVANSIFIIYRGNCILNIEENKDLMILSEDDVFGTESLANIDENGKMNNGKFLYNIINNSPNTILFKFFINDLNRIIINDLKNQLATNFLERNNIIQNHENRKVNLENKLIKKYESLKKKKDKSKLLSQSSFLRLSPEKVEKLYNKCLDKLRIKQKFINDKQKLIYKKTPIYGRNINKTKQILSKINKSKSYAKIFNFKRSDYSIDKNRKAIMSNLFLKKDIKDIKKIIINKDIKNIKKTILNYKTNKEKKEKKENRNNITIYPNKNHKNKSTTNFFDSSDTSNNKSFFYTSIIILNQHKNKPLYKTINLEKGDKGRRNFSMVVKGGENSMFKDEASKTNFASTIKNSRSFRNKSAIMSSKKQIEIYGCNALDTINYFNYGEKENSLNSSIYQNNDKKNNFKKCIFYKTKQFNIPFFTLFDEKEKAKFPYSIKL